jgi:predicted NUDIX family NTP pyrophosphohydrolase
MSRQHVSAGLLMYRIHDRNVEVLLAHPGGPFFRNKDQGVWSIPKGEIEPTENLLEAATREFREETGMTLSGPYIALTPVTQKGGKTVYAWACEGSVASSETVSNTFTMEWPPGSGLHMKFPEIDDVQFFDIATAKQKINAGQVPLIDELEKILSRRN